MSKHPLRIALLGLLSALIALSLWWAWPPARALGVGEMHPDVLLPTDPLSRGPFHGPQREWVIEGRTGEPIVLAVESFEFDSFLILADSSGRIIAASDDSGGFMNAKVAVTLPQTGRYTITVGGTDPEQYGAYRVFAFVNDQTAERDVRSYLARGLRWASRKGSRRAECLVNVAAARRFREMGNWREASERLNKARAASARSGFVFGRWAAALESGTLAARTMDFGHAMAELRSALALARQMPASPAAEARVLAQIGDVFLYLDKLVQAEACFRRAVRAAEESGNPSALARLCPSLIQSSLLGDLKADDLVRKAHDLRERLDPALRVDVDTAFAVSLSSAGDLAAAFAAIGQILPEVRALGYRDAEASLLCSKSMIEFRLGRTEAMARSAAEATAAVIPDDPDPMRLRKALQIQADAAMVAGDNVGALELCAKALRPMEAAWERQPVSEVRGRLLSGIKAVCSQIIANLTALNARRPSENYALKAFDYAERSRARALLLELGESRLQPPTGGDRSQLARESAIGRRILFFREGGEPDPAEVERIEAERTDVIATRISAQEKESRGLPETTVPIPITAEQVRRELFRSHSKAAVLSYQLRPRDGVLIVLTDETARLFVLPGWKAIGDAVTAWTGQASAAGIPVSDYARASRRLYDMLVAPCAPLIRGKDLIIVPDYMLNGLSFEALVVSAPENPASYRQLRYLVDEHAVTYAPSVSALAILERRSSLHAASKRNEVLLVGDPVSRIGGTNATSNASPSAASRDRTFSRLSGASAEVSEIARAAGQLHWKPDVRLGFDASKPALTADGALMPYRIVHIATHALADQVEGGLSGVVLSAGRGASGNDVFLTAEEVSHLKLAADLVVLSGCSTGLGQVTNAEGVNGLGQAFLIAGARRVCTTLWNVADDAPRQLMPEFYRRYLSRDSEPAEALRAAKRALIQAGAPPSVWAPMVLIGAPDEPVVQASVAQASVAQASSLCFQGVAKH